jgi:hypothetical protein
VRGQQAASSSRASGVSIGTFVRLQQVHRQNLPKDGRLFGRKVYKILMQETVEKFLPKQPGRFSVGCGDQSTFVLVKQVYLEHR